MTITFNDMTAAAEALLAAEESTALAEEALKVAKEHERKLREDVIPNMFSELHTKEFKLTDGSKFSVKQEVYSSVPVARREEAWTWLETNGHGGLIKTEVSVHFGKNELETANKLREALERRGLAPEMSRGVHPQTLKAWIRERLAAGENVNMELFGARAVDTAKVEKP